MDNREKEKEANSEKNIKFTVFNNFSFKNKKEEAVYQLDFEIID
jgi:hypothetical protein